MASPLLFSDLSLLSSSAAGDDNSFLLFATARALELGYAAVALDHPHRGLLADSHRCRTQPFPPLSSLPLPSSAALHRRRLASPTSEPFRQYTRITLSLDSPAAAASALAPSAARLLRTYDIVAARPLTQAAFDHLCQVPYSQQLDLISIDFSHKLPFRLKLPMLKLALQRGLHFEIAYAPFIAPPDGDSSRKNILADAKLLVDWTKGKNLIISSAAHTATQIRGPYDVMNLSSYLLGLPMHRAKAAISTNCRSLISMALRKKHFYKETIRIDRLLPHEQLDLTKFKLGDWIGWHSKSCKGHLQSLEGNQLEPSSNKDECPSSPIYGVIQVSNDKLHKPDASVIAKPSEQPTNDKEITSQTQDVTVQADGPTDRDLPILTTSFGHQNAVLDKTRNNEDVLDHFVQAASGHSVNLKSPDEHVDFVQDAMEVDATDSHGLNLVVGDSVPSTSVTGIKLAHSTLHQGLGLSGTSLQVKCPGQSSEILPDDGRSYPHTGCAPGEMEMTPLDHAISSVSDVCFEDRGADQSSDIPVNTEAYSGTSKPVECPPGGKDDKEPMDEIIEQTSEGEIESTDMKTRNDISMEPVFEGQEISSTVNTHQKRSTDSDRENDELKEQNSEETIASLEKDVAKTHPSGEAKIPTAKSEKRRRELRSDHPGYLPFLGFLKSMHFKKKVCKRQIKRLQAGMYHCQPSSACHGIDDADPSFQFASRPDALLASGGAFQPSLSIHHHQSQPLLSPTWSSFRRAMSTGDLTLREEEEEQQQREMAVAPPGRYSAEERRERIDKYRSKRNHRNFQKKITYACRKTLADSRPRVKGRFARNGGDYSEVEGAAVSESLQDADAQHDCIVSNNANTGGVAAVPEWWPAMQQALELPSDINVYDLCDEEMLAAYLGVSSISLYPSSSH
ncbi:hypothetical protein EJB05_54580, partial [Eragrostis curvula]